MADMPLGVEPVGKLPVHGPTRDQLSNELAPFGPMPLDVRAVQQRPKFATA